MEQTGKVILRCEQLGKSFLRPDGTKSVIFSYLH